LNCWGGFIPIFPPQALADPLPPVVAGSVVGADGANSVVKRSLNGGGWDAVTRKIMRSMEARSFTQVASTDAAVEIALQPND